MKGSESDHSDLQYCEKQPALGNGKILYFPDIIFLYGLSITQALTTTWYRSRRCSKMSEENTPALARSSVQPHTGLLREETLVLRQLLGYGSKVEAFPSTVEPEIGVSLSESSLRDVLLVGFDADTFQGYERLVEDQQIHVGISILDTRRLQELLLATSSMATEPSQLIKSFQFTIGDSAYCQRASRKFMFGDSKSAANTSELKSMLEAVIDDRDVVLIMHGTDSDLKMLQNLNINLRTIYVIDTNKAAQNPLQLSYRYDLETLLESLEIPYAALHAAGNDARFSLQALLMLAVKDAEQRPDASNESLLRVLRSVAQAPRPPTAAELKEVGDAARREAKAASKARQKARRAVRKETRRVEREGREANTASIHDSAS